MNKHLRAVHWSDTQEAKTSGATTESPQCHDVETRPKVSSAASQTACFSEHVNIRFHGQNDPKSKP